MLRIGNGFSEDVVVLDDLVDRFDHAVGVADIDTRYELPDVRGIQEVRNKSVVVLRPTIHDEVDMPDRIYGQTGAGLIQESITYIKFRTFVG